MSRSTEEIFQGLRTANRRLLQAQREIHREIESVHALTQGPGPDESEIAEMRGEIVRLKRLLGEVRRSMLTLESEEFFLDHDEGSL